MASTADTAGKPAATPKKVTRQSASSGTSSKSGSAKPAAAKSSSKGAASSPAAAPAGGASQGNEREQGMSDFDASAIAVGNVVMTTSHALSNSALNAGALQQQMEIAQMTSTVQSINAIFGLSAALGAAGTQTPPSEGET